MPFDGNIGATECQRLKRKEKNETITTESSEVERESEESNGNARQKFEKLPRY